MAEYMAAHIKIGGKLATRQIRNFVELIDGLSAEDYGNPSADYEYLYKCSEMKNPIVLYDAQARYGEFASLECFCIENNLTFKRQTSPYYEYEGEIRYFLPDTGDRRIGATDDGEPYLKLSELKEYLNKGLTLEKVNKIIEEYNENIPSFELKV